MCSSDYDMQCLGAFSRGVCFVCTDCDLGVTRADDVSDELWRLCLSTLEWTLVKVPTGGASPSGRSNHVMTSVGLDLWVHGGNTESGEGSVPLRH